MIKKTVVEKNRKYMFQFPDGTDSKKQEEYFSKLNVALEKDNFVAVDPKIKVFPTNDSHVLEEEIPDPAEVTTPTPDVPKNESQKPVETIPTTSNETTVQKVIVTPPEAPKTLGETLTENA